MNLFKRLQIVGLTLMLLALNACTAPGQKNVVDRRESERLHVFSIHDLDEDGRLSREEYRSLVEHRESYCKSENHSCRPSLDFELIDIDKNEYISEEEMAVALNNHLRKHRRNRYRGGQE